MGCNKRATNKPYLYTKYNYVAWKVKLIYGKTSIYMLKSSN